MKPLRIFSRGRHRRDQKRREWQQQMQRWATTPHPKTDDYPSDQLAQLHDEIRRGRS